MDVRQLRDMLRNAQEPKGFYFNRDEGLVADLLESLLVNKERYGYMSCPCRLASGDRERDKDIVCPCIYRQPDVREFGSCYCALYVSEEWNKDRVDHVHVPERRPAEKVI